jgi:hypothetical protein
MCGTPARCNTEDHPVEDQLHPIGPPQIQNCPEPLVRRTPAPAADGRRSALERLSRPDRFHYLFQSHDRVVIRFPGANVELFARKQATAFDGTIGHAANFVPRAVVPRPESRQTMTTVAPSSANWRAVARPTPLLAPVICTTLSSICISDSIGLRHSQYQNTITRVGLVRIHSRDEEDPRLRRLDVLGPGLDRHRPDRLLRLEHAQQPAGHDEVPLLRPKGGDEGGCREPLLRAGPSEVLGSFGRPIGILRHEIRGRLVLPSIPAETWHS